MQVLKIISPPFFASRPVLVSRLAALSRPCCLPAIATTSGPTMDMLVSSALDADSSLPSFFELFMTQQVEQSLKPAARHAHRYLLLCETLPASPLYSVSCVLSILKLQSSSSFGCMTECV